MFKHSTQTNASLIYFILIISTLKSWKRHIERIYFILFYFIIQLQLLQIKKNCMQKVNHSNWAHFVWITIVIKLKLNKSTAWSKSGASWWICIGFIYRCFRLFVFYYSHRSFESNFLIVLAKIFKFQAVLLFWRNFIKLY